MIARQTAAPFGNDCILFFPPPNVKGKTHYEKGEIASRERIANRGDVCYHDRKKIRVIKEMET